MGLTIVEKFLSAKMGKTAEANEIVILPVDLCVFHDGNRPLAIDALLEFGENKIFDSKKVIGVIDHAPAAQSENVIRAHNKMREFAKRHNIKLYQAGDGISHQLMVEQGHVVPGDIIIGSDSHTCTYGALNAFSTGVGVTDLAAAMYTGELWFKVPETVQVYGEGILPFGTTSKDVALTIARELGANGANYKALEFLGSGFASLSMSNRLTISNMAIEVGAKTGIFPFDEVTEGFLRNIPNGTSRVPQPQFADGDASYAHCLEIDFDKIEPYISLPHQVDKVVPVAQAAGTRISQAFIGTCTNGRIEDLREAANILQGRTVHKDVRLLVTPASRQVYQNALKEGLIEILMDAGAVIGIPGCSGCTGGTGFGVPDDGENVITTANRNFKGRTGNPKANLYLGSASTVAASALVGKICDPRSEMKVIS